MRAASATAATTANDEEEPPTHLQAVAPSAGAGAATAARRRRGQGPSASTVHGSIVGPERASAIQTVRWGVQVSEPSTVPAPFGSTSQPLAYPFTSLPPPTSWPLTEAVQPRLWLSPSTSQNGWSAPVTRTFMSVRPEPTTLTSGAPPGGCATAGMAPRPPGARGAPP